MHSGPFKPFRILLKCLRGLENNLISELQSFGFKNESLIKQKGAITIPNGDAAKLAFLSYFSRISSSVCVDVATFHMESKADIKDACMSIKWEEFIHPQSSIFINGNASTTTPVIKSKQYLSQLVKDGIVTYYNEKLNMDPPKVDYKNANVAIHVNVDWHSKVSLLVDAIGQNLNSRGYRDKPGIVDINGPLASALLQDIGYMGTYANHFQINEFMEYLNSGNIFVASKCATPATSWKDNVVVDLFAGCGVLLIEAAMHALRIAPGELIPNFAWQNFHLGQYANGLVRALKAYSNEKRVVTTSEEYEDVKGTLIGFEKNWEKVESILVSAERAKVLEALVISQANILKNGLQDNKKNIKGCKYLVAQLPKKFDLDATTTSSTAEGNLSHERYQQLLVNLGKHKRRYMPNATSLIIAPSIVESEYIGNAFGGCARSIKSFTKGGMQYCAHKVS